MMSSNGNISALLAICLGNSPVIGEFPSQRPWREALIFLNCAWINDLVNNGDAGDLRRHRAHYDVTVMGPTTVGSLWLENDLHENELEFESHMGRSKKFVRVFSDDIHGNPRDLNICMAPAAPPLCHVAANLCPESELSRESMKLGV